MVNFSDGAFGAACPSVPNRKSKGGAGGCERPVRAALRCTEVVIPWTFARRTAMRRKAIAAGRRCCRSASRALPSGIMQPRHHEARRLSGDAGRIAYAERCRGKSQVTGMPAARVVRVIRRQCD